MVMLAFVLTAALAAERGSPLFYWGAQPAAIVAECPSPAALEACVTEVHVAFVGRDAVVRFSFDRAVREALHLADGRPVSGRLRAVLYWDVDDRTGSGLDAGRGDARTGADRRLEIGVVSVGEDPAEQRGAQALVTAALYGVSGDFAQEVLWRVDDEVAPSALSWRGEWLEVRVPGAQLGHRGPGRVILTQRGVASVGRVEPQAE